MADLHSNITNMKRFFAFLVALFIIFFAKAEKVDSIYVGGSVVDAYTLRPIVDVQISATNEDEATPYKTKTVDWAKLYDIASDTGEELISFTLAVPYAGKWKIRVSKEGYEEQTCEIEIPEKEHGKRVTSFKVDDIKIQRKAIQLKEASVVASKIKMVMRGDTLVYNADAFLLEEGSLLDKLIEQLPGVKMEHDGRIFVNGEFVSSLLIDGKDFFNGDATVALNNLPAYLVKNIKVYRKSADYAYLQQRDSVEIKKDPLVIDVNLKKNYHNQWIANFEAGYGTRDLYRAKAFGIRFNDVSRITAFANVNNMGDDKSLSQDGVWNIDDITTIPSKIKQGGIDVLWQNRENHSYFTSDISAERESTHTILSEHKRSYFSNDGRYASLSRNDNTTKRMKLWWNNHYVLPLSKFYLEMQFRALYQNFNNSAQTRSSLLNNGMDEDLSFLDNINASSLSSDSTINFYRQQMRSKSDVFDTGLGILAKYKSPWTGNLISFDVDGAYTRTHLKSLDGAMLSSQETTTVSDKYNRAPQRSSHLGAGIGYEMKWTPWKVNLAYHFAKDVDTKSRNLYLLRDATDIQIEGLGNTFPTVLDSLLWGKDAINSFWYKERTTAHNMEARIEFSHKGNLLLFVLPVNRKKINADDTRLLSAQEKTYWLISPSLTWLSPKGFQAWYAFEMKNPNAANLLDITDNSELQYIYKGNPDLKVEHFHEFNFRYSGKKNKYTQTYDAALTWNIRPRKIVNASLLNPQTGIYTITPHNVSGNWDASLSANYGRALDKKQQWLFNANVQGNITNAAYYATSSTAMADLNRNGVTSYELSVNAKWQWQWQKLSASAKIGGHYLSARAHEGDNPYDDGYDLAYTLKAHYLMPWKTGLETSLTILTHYGYGDQMMNKHNVVWNAALSQPLLQNKFVLRLEAFDLLHEIRNYQRLFKGNTWTETTRNCLRNYFMLTLCYRLNIQPKKNNQ